MSTVAGLLIRLILTIAQVLDAKLLGSGLYIAMSGRSPCAQPRSCSI